MSNVILYEDKDVKISEKQLTIKYYHFPICTSKKIPILSIRKIQLRDLGWAKGRLWGMDATQWGYWLAGDLKRFSRQKFIGVEIGSWVKPSFTSEKIQTIYQLLSQLVEKNKAQKSSTQLKQQNTGTKQIKVE